MSNVYWDSMLFIYMIEGNPTHAERVKKIYRVMQQRGDSLYTSVLTLGEVLTGPRMLGAQDVVERVREYFLESGQVELIPVTAGVADQYSIIRAKTKLKPADALHLACATESKIDLFITHDRDLQKVRLPGVPFITGLDMQIFNLDEL